MTRLAAVAVALAAPCPAAPGPTSPGSGRPLPRPRPSSEHRGHSHHGEAGGAAGQQGLLPAGVRRGGRADHPRPRAVGPAPDEHTAMTYFVGQPRHRRRRAPAGRRLRPRPGRRSPGSARPGSAAFVGGTLGGSAASACCAPSGSRRPSRSPTRGANWFRCDVIALAADQRAGPADRPAGRGARHRRRPRPLRDVRHRRARHRGLPAGGLLGRATRGGRAADRAVPPPEAVPRRGPRPHRRRGSVRGGRPAPRPTTP